MGLCAEAGSMLYRAGGGAGDGHLQGGTLACVLEISAERARMLQQTSWPLVVSVPGCALLRWRWLLACWNDVHQSACVTNRQTGAASWPAWPLLLAPHLEGSRDANLHQQVLLPPAGPS